MQILDKIEKLHHAKRSRCNETLMLGLMHYDEIISYAIDGKINAKLALYIHMHVFNGDESVILDIVRKDPQYAYYYTRNIMKDRWKEAESYIIKNPDYAYLYALHILKGRWKEAEQYIMKSPGTAYLYVRDVIKDRWLEAEPYIMKSPGTAYLYARDVIKDRWIEAEQYLKKDRYCWRDYTGLYAGSI